MWDIKNPCCEKEDLQSLPDPLAAAMSAQRQPSLKRWVLWAAGTALLQDPVSSQGQLIGIWFGSHKASTTSSSSDNLQQTVDLGKIIKKAVEY